MIPIVNYVISLVSLLRFKIMITLHHLNISINILYPTSAAKDQSVNSHIHDAVCLHHSSLILQEIKIKIMACWLSASEQTDQRTLLRLSNGDFNLFLCFEFKLYFK